MSSTVHSPDCPDGMNMLADLAVHASSETALIHGAGRLLLSSVSEDLSSALSPLFPQQFLSCYSQGREFVSNISFAFGLEKNLCYIQKL